jgi:hypothetical protein
VALHGEQRRNILVEADATEGAVVGGNLVWSDGTVVSEADIRNSSITTTIVTGPGGVITNPTVWEVIIGVPDIIGSLEDLTDDGWIRNDAGTISALHWPYVKPGVDVGESFTLPAGEQLLVYESFSMDGTVTLDGQLVILGPDKDTGIIRSYIPTDLNILVPEWHQYIVYGNITLDGTMEIQDDAELVVLGGDEVDVRPLVSKTTTYTATTANEYILCDASGGAFTVTLPTAVGINGKLFTIKKTDSSGNAVTVDADGTETIDGALTKLISAPYDAMKIISDNSNWHIV